MTIQRQYSLPNCTLVLDGLGDGSVLMNVADSRPLMSMLINVECRLMGKEPLTGGRDFFEGLVQAVSQYVQELLSGVHPTLPATPGNAISLHRIDVNHHRLTVAAPDTAPVPATPASHPVSSHQVLLSTVELFDLAEAIDQFLADTRTLPELTLNLVPVAKRAVKSTHTSRQQVVPAAVGLSGLAAAAIAFALIPTPKIQEPADIVPKTNATATTDKAAAPGTPPSPAASASPTTSPTASPTSGPDVAKLEAQLTSAPAIQDAAQIADLQSKVTEQLQTAWKTPALTESLVYRIGVGADGAIVGYKAVSPTAAANAKQTPLVDIPYTQNRPGTEPLAQFQVTFTPEGKVQLEPWTEGSSVPTGKVQALDGAPLEITDAEQVKTLQPKLYDQLTQELAGMPKFSEDLVYRVRVQADGTIADYRPENQAAKDHDKDLTISKLGPIADDQATPQTSLAWFKAVIKPDGTLEVSPWRGVN